MRNASRGADSTDTAPAARPLSVAETAGALGVSRRTVLNWIHDGSLGAARLGPRNYRVPASEVARLLEPILRATVKPATRAPGNGVARPHVCTGET